MRKNRNRLPLWFMVMGFVFLTLGFSTENTAFTYAAIVFTVIAMVMNWMQRRR